MHHTSCLHSRRLATLHLPQQLCSTLADTLTADMGVKECGVRAEVAAYLSGSPTSPANFPLAGPPAEVARDLQAFASAVSGAC